MNTIIYSVKIAKRVDDDRWYAPEVYQEFDNEHDARTTYNKIAKVNRRKPTEKRDHIEFFKQNVIVSTSGARRSHGPQERIAVCGIYNF